MNKKDILDKFGKYLIREVRDRTLEINELIMQGNMGSRENQALYKLTENLSDEIKVIINKYILKNVDSTLHYFLWLIEQHDDLDLTYYTDEQKLSPYSLKEISDGLCGELYTEDGWIAKYSQYPPSIE
jgi:GH25 family lysozyme M1 (1,4-beta-N-acetylmuramidase)